MACISGPAVDGAVPGFLAASGHDAAVDVPDAAGDPDCRIRLAGSRAASATISTASSSATPDADHLAGLRRLLAGELTLKKLLGLAAWDLPLSRTAPTNGSTTDARDWHAYQRYRSGGMISLTKRLSPLAGARGISWSDDGIEILAPTRLDALLDGLLGRYNDMSYVVRVWHAGRSILVPGDIKEPGWRRLLEGGVDPCADVLVASHHGRRSGYEVLSPEKDDL
jgi:hypothetical protein